MLGLLRRRARRHFLGKGRGVGGERRGGGAELVFHDTIGIVSVLCNVL